MFKFNMDLEKINFKSWHNWFHLCACIVLSFASHTLGLSHTATQTFLQVFILGFIWEIGDGFKPWYIKFKYNEHKSYLKNWLRENLLYSNGFSVEDLIWNGTGSLIGATLAHAVL